MKIGRILRRLRMAAFAPLKYQPSGCLPTSPDSSSCICASACFLIYAGAVDRTGGTQLLALHRPYLTREAASKVTTTQQEVAQKQIMSLVRRYLEEMEIPNYYIDKMMSRSSQDAYLISHIEATSPDHPLSGYVASIEEITLSKCKTKPKREREQEYEALGQRIRERGGIPLDKNDPSLKKFMDETDIEIRCKIDVVDEMRTEAFHIEFAGEHW